MLKYENEWLFMVFASESLEMSHEFEFESIRGAFAKNTVKYVFDWMNEWLNYFFLLFSFFLSPFLLEPFLKFRI